MPCRLGYGCGDEIIGSGGYGGEVDEGIGARAASIVLGHEHAMRIVQLQQRVGQIAGSRARQAEVIGLAGGQVDAEPILVATGQTVCQLCSQGQGVLGLFVAESAAAGLALVEAGLDELQFRRLGVILAVLQVGV